MSLNDLPIIQSHKIRRKYFNWSFAYKFRELIPKLNHLHFLELYWPLLEVRGTSKKLNCCTNYFAELLHCTKIWFKGANVTLLSYSKTDIYSYLEFGVYEIMHLERAPNTYCTVILEAFLITIEDTQGCLLSHLYFLVAFKWTTSTTNTSTGKDIHTSFRRKAGDPTKFTWRQNR